MLCVWLLLWAASGIRAQAVADLLLSGPMVGYVDMREALLWVQTNGPAQVYFEYSDGTEGVVFRTGTYTTNQPEAYTARLIADQVKPGQQYTYKLFINGEEVARPYPMTFQTPPIWRYRSDPPEMRIALGSCTYVNDPPYDRPGTPYGDGYRIFESIQRMQPDIMLWLGDNTYLREGDFFTRTGMIHRYTHTRHIPEMQALLASAANYAIWDDHDYGPNDSDYTFRDRDRAREAFRLFWGNPSYGLDGRHGTTTTFEWGDAQFFLLDNRYFRDPNNRQATPRTILGAEQAQWLIDALVSSRATFKFVCIGGQVLNSVDDYETYTHIAPEEREMILSRIAAEGIKNVIFLTGDRHHSELSMLERDGVKIYDFTASPLTSGSHDASKEANKHRVAGSFVGVRNFGVMNITGPQKARKLSFSCYDTDGKLLWSQEIAAE
ncbi:MAG: alkaline phosphatase D family protein [Bacteroidia bacterium]